jgi:hypothetical protein
MSWYLNPMQVKRFAETATGKGVYSFNAKQVLQELLTANDKFPTGLVIFDIFLSYRAVDVEYAAGVYAFLTRLGYKVYLDRIMDPHLDRTKVNIATGNCLRGRLMQSLSLFYVVSENSADSKWMPWELGFEDGYRAKSAVVPIADKNRAEFVGVEFAAIYPKVIPAINESMIFIVDPDESGQLTEFKAWRDSIPSRKCGMPKCPL